MVETMSPHCGRLLRRHLQLICAGTRQVFPANFDKVRSDIKVETPEVKKHRSGIKFHRHNTPLLPSALPVSLLLFMKHMVTWLP